MKSCAHRWVHHSISEIGTFLAVYTKSFVMIIALSVVIIPSTRNKKKLKFLQAPAKRLGLCEVWHLHTIILLRQDTMEWQHFPLPKEQSLHRQTLLHLLVLVISTILAPIVLQGPMFQTHD